jgi:alpha-mannosidase
MITINKNHKQLDPLWNSLKSQEGNPNFNRLYSELRFLCAVSDNLQGRYDGLLGEAAAALAGEIRDREFAAADTVKKIETMLSPMAAEAKGFEFICVSHAHIDMNWMWGYQETVSVTLATMRTMLDLLEEYPGFIFSQSQASVYRIIEEFAPDMFEEVKKRIQEGRWEITASTWVEADKNMPSGESLSRHMLYTKNYMAEKFGVSPEDLVIDFEPDTFGHSRNVPEILNSGGVRYYYHFRGHVGEKILYRWKAPSGADIIVYSDPFTYGGPITCELAEYAPEMARITGGKTLMKVYGVGDHGGGPTRRDLNRIIEMNSWPLFPKFTFGRLRDYFTAVESRKAGLPVLEDEMNFICDGCYTTQTRIKAGNLKAERLLGDAEFYACAGTVLAGRPYPADSFVKAWRKILFNQFHDIVTGSGVIQTREYAGGEYQKVFAAAESASTLSLEAIAKNINTAPLFNGAAPPFESTGQGAGAGYGQTGRGVGKERVYHIFNPLPYDRQDVVMVTIWDYEGDISQIAAKDGKGKALRIQAVESANYWGHRFNNILVEAAVPACGYAAIFIEEKPDYTPKTGFYNDMRIQTPDTFVLENEYLRVRFNPLDGSIASLVDKKSGAELAPPEGGMGVFRLANECINKAITDWDGGMSSWFVGRFNEICSINRRLEIVPFSTGELRNAFRMNGFFGNNSAITVIVSLDAGAKLLRYEVSCDWHEYADELTHGPGGFTGVGRAKMVRQEGTIPNLHFYLPLNYAGKYHYDIPGGFTVRPPADMDVPAQSLVLAENPGQPVSLALFSQNKYGFRCLEKSIALTLIRGSNHPDRNPENYEHQIEFAIAVVPAGEAAHGAVLKNSLCYRHPFTVISGKARTGKLELSGSLISHTAGNVAVSAVKQAEGDAKKIILRVYETEGKNTTAEFKLGFAIKAAYFTDVTEKKRLDNITLKDGGETLGFDIPPYSIRAVALELA